MTVSGEPAAKIAASPRTLTSRTRRSQPKTRRYPQRVTPLTKTEQPTSPRPKSGTESHDGRRGDALSSSAAGSSASDTPVGGYTVGGYTVGDGTRTRIAAVVILGAALLGVLLFFRFEKVSVIHLDLGVFDAVSLLLPEIGAVALLEIVFLALALVPGKAWSWVWWPLFLLAHGTALLGATVEHTFYLHTGSRLNLDLISYALNNRRMLEGLVLSGADSSFRGRLLISGLLMLLALLLVLRFRRAFPLRPLLAGLAVAAVAGLLLPATATVRRADLAPGTFAELIRRPAGPEEAEIRAAALVTAPEELYQPPRLTDQPSPIGEAAENGPMKARGEVAEGKEVVRPNVVLVILESTRYDVTAPYALGEWQGLTPALGRIADEGWVYDTVYASVSHTSKALVGILCGAFPRLEIPIRESLRGGLPLRCLPHLLGEAGYRSLFVQTAISSFENRPGLIRNVGYGAAGFMETVKRPGFGRTGYLGIDDFALIDPALSWVENGGEEPFFLTVLTLGTHHPYHIPGTPEPPKGGNMLPHYLEAIRYQDRFLEALLERLEEAGALENTVLLILGDHGEAFAEHRRMQHDGVPYEEAMRVPLVLHAPGILGEPRRVGGLRHHVDVLPTLLELTGVSWEGVLPGRSLLREDGHERVVSSCWYTDYCLAMREGDLKYVYHFGMRPTEVFDLVRDPLERHSLAETLPPEELRQAESRMLGAKLSVDAFWQDRPPEGKDLLWWQQEAAAPPPDR